jgi:Domain of unknown function (DUF5122) beta-propeller
MSGSPSSLVLRVVWYVRALLARRLLMALVIAVCLSLGTAVSASAAPGDLDTSYGKGGAAIADFGTFANGAVVDNAIGSGMVVQPDGKVIVVGTGIDQFGQTSDIVTARFTTSGALDVVGRDGEGAVRLRGERDRLRRRPTTRWQAGRGWRLDHRWQQQCPGRSDQHRRHDRFDLRHQRRRAPRFRRQPVRPCDRASTEWQDRDCRLHGG